MDYISYLVWAIIIGIIYDYGWPLYPFVVITIMANFTGLLALVYWAYKNPREATMGYMIIQRDMGKQLDKLWPSIKVKDLPSIKIITLNGDTFYVRKSIHINHSVIGVKDNI